VRIGIFGHSMGLCRYSNTEVCWTNKLASHYNAEIINFCSTACSEERILFNLKKTKDLDLAILFHARPRYLFIPKWHRDVDTLDKTTIQLKAGQDLLQALQQEYDISDEALKQIDSIELMKKLEMFNKIPDISVFSIVKNVNFQEAFKLLDTADPDNLHEAFLQFIHKHSNQAHLYAELIDCLSLNRKFMFDVDLQNNRFQGALVLIDQYLTHKQIPCVHCIQTKSSIPSWFKFQSGIVDYELADYQNKYKNPCKSDALNSMSLEGHQKCFEQMLPLIQAARSRVELR